MKHQALFSSIDKSKKLKCHLLQFLFGTLRVKVLLLLLCCSFTSMHGKHLRSCRDGQLT